MVEDEKWLNTDKISDAAISTYRQSLLSACPNHVVIDNLFAVSKLDDVIAILQQPQYWQTQQHTYSALYVDQYQWQQASVEERFVQRDSWQRDPDKHQITTANSAQEFLNFLRSDEFMSVLSKIFNTRITDINVGEPAINTNYFRLGANDFVEQHADDSPGREICMLLYLNTHWKKELGGELVFIGEHDNRISIAPLFNRCVLFDPSSKGSEHWVNKLNSPDRHQYRYNITSWYWSE